MFDIKPKISRIILVIGFILTSILVVSALNQSENITGGVVADYGMEILPVEEGPISILPEPEEIPIETPTSDMVIVPPGEVEDTEPAPQAPEEIVSPSNVTVEAAAPSENVNFLAKVYHEDSLSFDRAYAQEYLQLRNNFTDLKYERIFQDKEISLTLGNKINNLKGIQTDRGKFAIDVVYCDEFSAFCVFRINGVPTGKMFTSDSFAVDGQYVLRVASVKVNQCDNHRFCHLGYEGYHKVDVVMERG